MKSYSENVESRLKSVKFNSKFSQSNSNSVRTNFQNKKIPIQKMKNPIQEMKNTILKVPILEPKVDFPNLILALFESDIDTFKIKYSIFWPLERLFLDFL